MSANTLTTGGRTQRFPLADWWSRNQRKVIPYIFLAPFLLSFAIFTVYPAGTALFLSFQRTRFLAGGSRRRGRPRIQGPGELRAPADQGQALSRSHDQWRRILAWHLARADAAGAGCGAGSKLTGYTLQGIGIFDYPAASRLIISVRGFLPAEAGGGVVLEYKGLENYERLLTRDRRFREAMINGAEFWLGTLLVQMPLALAVALALNSRDIRFKVLGRLGFFAPYITSAVVVGWIFRFVFDQRFGWLNSALAQLGIEGPAWLRDGISSCRP